MPWRTRTGFWTLALLAVILLAVPSAVLIDAARRYYSFFTGFEPETVKMRPVSFVPHSGPRHETPEPDSLRFVEFSYSAPKAKRVYLTGDFAQWKPDALPLSRGSGGKWEVALPLPPGRYHYLFMADGRPARDPKNPASERSGEREASVLMVP